MVDLIIAKFNYWVYVVLMMIGLYAMIAKNNLVKKVIGMNIFQTAIIVYYVSIGSKKGGATIPVLEGGHGAEAAATVVDVSRYLNPLPHVLMLTAIVVSVATLGVALAIMLRIHRRYGTLEEDEILEQLD